LQFSQKKKDACKLFANTFMLSNTFSVLSQSSFGPGGVYFILLVPSLTCFILFKVKFILRGRK